MMVKPAASRLTGSAFGVIGLCVALLPTLAAAGDPDPIADEIRKSIAQDSGTPPEPINWDALNWDPWSLTTASKQRSFGPKDPVESSTQWDRKVNPDGSTAFTAKKQLPTALDTKVGVDLGLAPNQPDYLTADRIVNGAPTNTGTAWANVTVSGASIDARLDPRQDQARLGTTLKKSVPVNDTVSFSVENGYAVTDTYAGSTASTATWGVPPSSTTASRIYSTDGVAKMTIEPTGTTFSTGTRLSSTDDKWRRSLGAEQKLFGGLNVTGSVSETDTGVIDRTLGASFKKTW